MRVATFYYKKYRMKKLARPEEKIEQGGELNMVDARCECP